MAPACRAARSTTHGRWSHRARIQTGEEGPHQRRLADPGLAADEAELPAGPASLRERLAQHLELGVAADHERVGTRDLRRRRVDAIAELGHEPVAAAERRLADAPPRQLP